MLKGGKNFMSDGGFIQTNDRSTGQVLQHARHLFQSNKLEEAAVSCHAVIARSPEFWQAKLLLARISLKMGDVHQAEISVESAKQDGAVELPLSKIEEVIACAKGDFPKQIQLLKKLILVEPKKTAWRNRLIVSQRKSDFQNARQLFQSGGFKEAKTLCQAIISGAPKFWQARLLLARIALKMEDIRQAELCIKSARQLGAPELTLSKVEEEIANIKGNFSSQIQLLTKLILAEPKKTYWHNRLTAALLAEQEYLKIFSVLKNLLLIDPKALNSTSLLNELYENLDSGVFISNVSDLIEIAPCNMALRLSRALSLCRQNNMDDAWLDIEAACNIDNELPLRRTLGQDILRHVGESARHREKLQQLYLSHLRCAPLFWLWSTVLDHEGKVEEFRRLVKDNWHWASSKSPTAKALYYMQNAYNKDIPVDKKSRKVQFLSRLMDNNIDGAIQVAPSEEDRNLLLQVRNLIPTRFPTMAVAEYSQEFKISGAEGPNGIVIAFSGLADRMSVPAHILDYFFAELGLTAVYLRDFSRLLFLNGLKSLGGSLDSTSSKLTEIIDDLGVDKPIFTFGNSAGGMAAIVYAEVLGAKASLVFSPLASVNPADQEILGETRAQIVAKRLFKNLDHSRLDLNKILNRAHEDYCVTAYVGADSPFDRPHANMLATMPRTNVILLDGVNQHNVFSPVASRFGMLTSIREAFRL